MVFVRHRQTFQALESRGKLFKEIMTGMNHLVLGNMQRLLVLKDCYLLSKAGLLRTSTPSPSWICEAHVPVPKVVTDVLVFVVNNRLLEYQDGEDVDVLQRPDQRQNASLEKADVDDYYIRWYLLFRIDLKLTWSIDH